MLQISSEDLCDILGADKGKLGSGDPWQSSLSLYTWKVEYYKEITMPLEKVFFIRRNGPGGHTDLGEKILQPKFDTYEKTIYNFVFCPGRVVACSGRIERIVPEMS